MTQFDSRVSVSPDVMVRRVGAESVLLDLKTERYLGLDEIGSDMWQSLTESESVEAAYQSLLRKFDVEGEELKRDLDEFVQELLSLGLVGFASKQ